MVLLKAYLYFTSVCGPHNAGDRIAPGVMETLQRDMAPSVPLLHAAGSEDEEEELRKGRRNWESTLGLQLAASLMLLEKEESFREHVDLLIEMLEKR